MLRCGPLGNNSISSVPRVWYTIYDHYNQLFIINFVCPDKMARSTLQELKQELTPYMIQQQLIDETDERIGNGAYGVISKAKYCETPCALKELYSFLLPQHEAGDEANSRGDLPYSVQKFGALRNKTA